MRYYLGVDMGGTKVAAHGIDLEGKPLECDWRVVDALVSEGPRRTVSQMIVALQAVMDAAGIGWDDVAAVGLDTPGPADIDGTLHYSANLHSQPEWQGFGIRAALETAIGDLIGRPMQVTYDNDGNAAAHWEAHLLDPKGEKIVVLLAPGTGIGGGVVVHGDLLRGARGMAAELGHIRIPHNPFLKGMGILQCGCGKLGCAEAYASKAALENNLLPQILRRPEYADHPLQSIPDPAKRAYEVRTLAGNGDSLCRKLFLYQAERLGELGVQVANVLDPSVIVIGGGFIEGTPELTEAVMERIRDSFKREAFAKHGDPALGVEIVTASSGDRAGALGAALSAMKAH
ncbi:MAG: ROK family protein [Deltaproteobacteria bacterium]|nr:ROK family protein [Deltaproteobacteria bacterium]